MVAKSYQSFEVISDVYTINGRAYVKVKNPKNGNSRQVRWYDEKEYKKLYPPQNDSVSTDQTPQPIFQKTKKEILGFAKDYITIFKGDTYAQLEWFKASICQYHKLWGWYVISTKEVPEDLPPEIEPILLSWNLVGNEDGSLKEEMEVRTAVESLIYEDHGSEFQGEIGERLDLYLTVRKALVLDGRYGVSTLHEMDDDMGNTYIWITASKSLQEGQTYHLRGTVKDHKIYRNCKQTILTRCLLAKN